MTTIQTRRFATPAAFNAALVERLRRAVSAPEGDQAAVMLSGGKTPLTAYRELAQQSVQAASGLRILFSDDRYVPIASESSNFHQSRPLLDSLALPPTSVIRVRTELPIAEAASDYERQLAALLRSGRRIGLGLLGLGADGHTASLFNTGQLEEARGHLAIAVQRPDGLQGISVTPELLSQVAELVFLVSGADKHAIVTQFLRSDSELTARRAVAACPTVHLWTAD